MIVFAHSSPDPTLALAVDPDTAQITLHELHRDGVRELGRFGDAAAAWAAVDGLDATVAMSQPPDCSFVVAPRS
jgi:hypothetical protein